MNDFFQRLLLHIFQRYDFSGFIGIATKQKEVVDFFLGKRKSRGRKALCSVDKTDLFIFGEEKVQTQLLISSVITTSSACAFRLFMCCTHAICCGSLCGAGLSVMYCSIVDSTLAFAVSSSSHVCGNRRSVRIMSFRSIGLFWSEYARLILPYLPRGFSPFFSIWRFGI